VESTLRSMYRGLRFLEGGNSSKGGEASALRERRPLACGRYVRVDSSTRLLGMVLGLRLKANGVLF
jgi:hypothetical protein